MVAPFISALIRIITVAAPILVKSFAEAYRQAAARAAPISAPGMNKMGVHRITPMTKQEAIKILGLEDKYDENQDFDFAEAQEHFERMFTENDPEKGGSFYLQSKIYRARECLEMELLKSGKLSKEKAAQFRKVAEMLITKKSDQQEEAPRS